MVVLSGLRPRKFFWELLREDEPGTYHEFLNRAEKYLSAEEATSDQDEERTGEKGTALKCFYLGSRSITHS